MSAENKALVRRYVEEVLNKGNLALVEELFDTNPLQRCFRDIYAAGQHFTVSQSAYRTLGQFKLKQPDANPML